MTALVLGTAQFGAGYGITNATGRIDDAAVGEILGIARSGGIDLFDTAADYGDSQARLGKLNAGGARYITKFSLPSDLSAPIDSQAIFGRSAQDLQASTLHGVLFHRVCDLVDARFPQAVEVLRDARDAGTVTRIGVSIYDERDLESSIAVFPDLDLLQIPGNLIDRRLLEHPAVGQLKSSGVEIHVRSAFLQGLILAAPETLPGYFAPLRSALKALAATAAEQETTVLELALRFLKNHDTADGVLVGATSAGEISSIIDAWNGTLDRSIEFEADVPDDILDPRGWPQQKVIS